MKKMWKKPSLEVLDVNMTMKRPGGDGGDNGAIEDPSNPKPENPFDS